VNNAVRTENAATALITTSSLLSNEYRKFFPQGRKQEEHGAVQSPLESAELHPHVLHITIFMAQG
jgi:hypothetical protein